MDEKRQTPMAEGALHTRREFIRKVLLKTAYTAPIIATFSVASVASANGSPSPGRMMTKMMMMKWKTSGQGMLW